MKLIQIPVVHVRGCSTSPRIGNPCVFRNGEPYDYDVRDDKYEHVTVDFDGFVDRSTVWLNPDYIISIRETVSSGWSLIEGLRAKHSFSKDDVATGYGDKDQFYDEWSKENPEDRDEKWSDAEWEKWNDDCGKAVDAWEQTFCDKHGFERFVEFKYWWRQWELLHYAVQDETPFDITELCPPQSAIFVQVGSACEEYRTLESIPDLLARINPGSHEALVAAFAAGGNQ